MAKKRRKRLRYMSDKELKHEAVIFNNRLQKKYPDRNSQMKTFAYIKDREAKEKRVKYRREVDKYGELRVKTWRYKRNFEKAFKKSTDNTDVIDSVITQVRFMSAEQLDSFLKYLETKDPKTFSSFENISNLYPADTKVVDEILTNIKGAIKSFREENK